MIKYKEQLRHFNYQAEKKSQNLKYQMQTKIMQF